MTMPSIQPLPVFGWYLSTFKKKKNKSYYYLVVKDGDRICANCCSGHVNKDCSTVRCKKCCIDYCLEEHQKCKCKDHLKGMKAKKKKDLEELAEAGILDEVVMEDMIEEGVYLDD